MASDMAEPEQSDTVPWKLRVEEPTNRFVYYPIARRIVRLLVKVPITPNQVTMVQPAIAAAAGYLIAVGDATSLVLGAVVFELRSLLDCVDGTLARAKRVCSPGGHALDALCDWLGVFFLYLGILIHFLRVPPPSGDWQAYMPVVGIVALAGFQGALRSASADYYMRKLTSILDEGRDETVENLRERHRNAAAPMERAEVTIGMLQHLLFEQSIFDADRTPCLDEQQVDALRHQREGRSMRLLSWVWSLSNGDAFIRITVLSLFLGPYWMWELQLFWASLGWIWIIGVVVASSWFVRRALHAAESPVGA